MEQASMIPMEIDVSHMREVLDELQGPVEVAQLIFIDRKKERKTFVSIDVGHGEDGDLEVTMSIAGSRQIGDYKHLRIFSSDWNPMPELEETVKALEEGS